jgi:hypothetical protein
MGSEDLEAAKMSMFVFWVAPHIVGCISRPVLQVQPKSAPLSWNLRLISSLRKDCLKLQVNIHLLLSLWLLEYP